MKLATKKERIRTKKERLAAQKKEQKNRDTVLMILSISFLIGGILGCLLEGKLSAGAYVSQFLAHSTQSAVAPSFWRELWTVFRWPAAVIVLGLLPLTGLTVPALFFLRGFFLSYGIVALMEGLGGTGQALSLGQPVCWPCRLSLSWVLRNCWKRQTAAESPSVWQSSVCQR